MEPVIVTDKLTKRFDEFIACNELTFEVGKGEIFGFLGANGAGKTTAMRMLCGLLKPSSGKASVIGYDIFTQTEEIKRNIGYMSQKFSLYDNLTVAENIKFYGGIYGMRRKDIAIKTDELLSELQLQNEKKTLVSELPLGWKQKLSFSVSMVHSPKIVFLDEPTSGIDPLARRAFWYTIGELANQGITIIITTHFMEEAEYCDRIAIQDAGKMLALGTPKDIRSMVHGEGVNDMNSAFIAIVEQSRASQQVKEASV